MPEWHSTFTRMRGGWPGCGASLREVVKRLADGGIVVGSWEIKRICLAAGLWPPPKAYGHFAYQPEHIEAVRAYADREGLILRKETT